MEYKYEEIISDWIKYIASPLINTTMYKVNEYPPKYRHPNEKEIYKFIKSILCQKLYSGYINTSQYRSLLGFARRNNKQCERELRNWFLKHDQDSWIKIEKYINSSIPEYKVTVTFPYPVKTEIIDIDISK